MDTFCFCGCGSKLSNVLRHGKPLKFIHGHNWRNKKRSVETKKLMSLAQLGNKKCLGRKLTEEQKMKFMPWLYPETGVINPRLGKKQSKELIAKRMLSRRWYKHSDATKEKIRVTNLKYSKIKSLRMIGDKNHFYGKHHSEITKQKIRLKCLGRSPPNKGKKASEKERIRLRLLRMNNILPKKDTSIEVMVQLGLDVLGIKYEKHKLIIFSDGTSHRADLFIEPMIVIECDGCYFHACPVHCPDVDKYSKTQLCTIKNDKRVNLNLTKLGYIVIRLFEHEIKTDKDACIFRIIKLINSIKYDVNGSVING